MGDFCSSFLFSLPDYDSLRETSDFYTESAICPSIDRCEDLCLRIYPLLLLASMEPFDFLSFLIPFSMDRKAESNSSNLSGFTIISSINLITFSYNTFLSIFSSFC